MKERYPNRPPSRRVMGAVFDDTRSCVSDCIVSWRGHSVSLQNAPKVTTLINELQPHLASVCQSLIFEGFPEKFDLADEFYWRLRGGT